jgi:hypothetical protein
LGVAAAERVPGSRVRLRKRTAAQDLTSGMCSEKVDGQFVGLL